MKKILTRKTTGILILLSILFLAGGGYYLLFAQPEVDSAARNGPLESEMINQTSQLPLLAEAQLAAGIAYDFEHDRFLISTDEPHTLLPQHEASVFWLNSALTEIIAEIKLPVDGDLEGMAYLGGNTAVTVSEVGTLIYLHVDDDHGVIEQKRTAIFADGQAHKLGSLAYDSDNQHLYTAEKVGSKTIYQLDREGNLLSSFTLQLPNDTANSVENAYTIAGMSYTDGYLYLFSEAYATIFKLNVHTQEVEQIWGVDQLPEAAGITIKDNQFYIVGDQENYLPVPQIHIVNMPDS